MTLNLSSNNLKVSWRMCIGGTQSGNTAPQLGYEVTRSGDEITQLRLRPTAYGCDHGYQL